VRRRERAHHRSFLKDPPSLEGVADRRIILTCALIHPLDARGSGPGRGGVPAREDKVVV
jgi:hypothetical protein